jgi:hypothetical protein
MTEVEGDPTSDPLTRVTANGSSGSSEAKRTLCGTVDLAESLNKPLCA